MQNFLDEEAVIRQAQVRALESRVTDSDGILVSDGSE
jgi:hypothetical protein